MFSMVRQRGFIVLFLMGFLLLGATAAQARDRRDTNGSDRLVKGVAIGAAVGAVTQVVRGRTEGRELLKGAAVGGAVGGAVGAYSDYKQEKSAREDAERYRHRDRYYRGGDRYYRGDSYRSHDRYDGRHRQAYRGNGRGRRCR
jgi:putative salt-induced outer membrane protein YdiY